MEMQEINRRQSVGKWEHSSVAPDQIRTNTNTDPQTPTPSKKEPNHFLALSILRHPSRSSSWFPSFHSLCLLSSMPGPTRTKDSAAAGSDWQPPRPPNAWILYRSDKLRQLPPVEPGGPRRAQADVSRLIAQMWKSETEQTRTEYERRADAKKAEHAILYPNYRFQPQTKEQKEISRAQKKKDKASKRRGPQASQATMGGLPPMSLPPPQLSPYYRHDVRFEPTDNASPFSGEARSPVLERYSSSPNGLSSDGFLTPDSFTGGSSLPLIHALQLSHYSQSTTPASQPSPYGLPQLELPQQSQDAGRWDQLSSVAHESHIVPSSWAAAQNVSQPEATPTTSVSVIASFFL